MHFAVLSFHLQTPKPEGLVSKTFGGFKPGLKFSFIVEDVSSSQAIGKSKVRRDVPIPSGIPKFKKGQTVKFRIGSKGQLSGCGFSLPFLYTSSDSNSYEILSSLNRLSSSGASVSKSSSGKPTGCSLVFYKYRVPGATVDQLTVNQVRYILQ